MAAATRANMSLLPEVSPEEKNNRLCQFTKTKLCKFHAVGKCTKGMQCPFAHEGMELRKLPDLRCTKICKALIHTGQCTRKPCMYAHSKQELRSTGAFHKTKFCRFMQTGHCTLGAKCNFAHSAVELREPETIEVVEPGAPPGLGWESMVSGLLSDDEDEMDSASPPPGFQKPSRNAVDKDVEPDMPAYVPLAPSSESWTTEFLASARMAQEKQDHREGLEAFKKENISMESFWDVQNLLASSGSMGFPDLGFYSPEGSKLPYAGAFNEFATPWASEGLLIEQYASLFGNSWDWQNQSGNIAGA